jgi:hypothetical protein
MLLWLRAIRTFVKLSFLELFGFFPHLPFFDV